MQDIEKSKEQIEVIKDKKDKKEKKNTYKGNIYKKNKNNVSLCTVSFSGIWFFLTLLVKVFIRFVNKGYYDSLKLDKSYFYYNDEDLTICMFYAAFFLVTTIIVIIIYLELNNLKLRFVFSIFISIVSLYISGNILSENDISQIVIWALLAELSYIFLFLWILSTYMILEKKFNININVNIKIFLALILVMLLEIPFHSNTLLPKLSNLGELMLSNNPTFEIAYVDNDDSKDREYYIILWKNDDKLYMRKIKYDANIKKLVIPKENQIIIGEGLSDFKYFSETFESVEIEKPIAPEVIINFEIELKMGQWQFEFVTLDDGIEYVSKGRIGSDPLYLYQYTIESLEDQIYIVVDRGEWIIVDRKNIKQSRCVDSLYYKEHNNKKPWKLIDYRDFEDKKLENESSQSEVNNLENLQ